MKKIVIILGLIIIVLIVITGVVFVLLLLQSEKDKRVDDEASQSVDVNIPPDRETFPIGDDESVKFEGKTISIEVAKDIILTENGNPKCMVLKPKGDNPEADKICKELNQ